jgi:hypothetical protein
MKQIDKLAWIEIKDKKYFQPEVWKRQILSPREKRSE